MAIIGIRELLRDNKKIIERLQSEQEAFLITHHGKPVAALVPVDPANAEQFLVAANPELNKTFRDAARAAEAGEELETVSIEALSEEHGDDEDAEEGVVVIGPWKATLAADAEHLFGPELAETFADAAAMYLERVTLSVANAVGKEERAAATPRIGELNVELFRSVLPGVVSATASKRASQLPLVGYTSQGLFGLDLVEEALTRTAERVETITSSMIAFKGGLSLDDVERTLQTSIAGVSFPGEQSSGGMKSIDFREVFLDKGLGYSSDALRFGKLGKFSPED
jgi:antitoxin (DNA-binding transcriptional repressor) of toxin-antitoxin stability system